MAAENNFPSTLPEHLIQNEFVARSRFGGSAAIIMELCTARPDGQPIIDFGSLPKIAVHFVSPYEIGDLQEMSRLY